MPEMEQQASAPDESLAGLIAAQPVELAKEAAAVIVAGDPVDGAQDLNAVARAVQTLQLLKAGWQKNPEVWEAIERILSGKLGEQAKTVQAWLLAIAAGQQKVRPAQLAALIAYSKAAGILVERTESVNIHRIEVSPEEAKTRLLALAKDVKLLAERAT